MGICREGSQGQNFEKAVVLQKKNPLIYTCDILLSVTDREYFGIVS
jgi:hypothetical protein